MGSLAVACLGRGPNNTARINTKYNIIRIIHNTAGFPVYYPTLPNIPCCCTLLQIRSNDSARSACALRSHPKLTLHALAAEIPLFVSPADAPQHADRPHKNSRCRAANCWAVPRPRWPWSTARTAPGWSVVIVCRVLRGAAQSRALISAWTTMARAPC